MGNCVHGTKSNQAFLFLERIHAFRNKVTHSLVALTNLYAYQKIVPFCTQQIIHSQNNVKKRKKIHCKCVYVCSAHNKWQQQFGSCDFRKVGFHICFILIIDIWMRLLTLVCAHKTHSLTHTYNTIIQFISSGIHNLSFFSFLSYFVGWFFISLHFSCLN